MHQGIGLDAFNELAPGKALHALYECCYSVTLAGDLASGRPYRSHDELFRRASKDDVAFSIASFSGTPVDTALTAESMSGGGILGTPGYMSPEQVKGQRANRTSDIWAFGCVLYEILTGCRTFDGDSAAEILATGQPGRAGIIELLAA